MKKKITFIAIAAFVISIVSNGIVLATPKGTLDGKTFSGQIVSKGEDKPFSDNFVFKDGTFRSTACDEYGFTAAPYTTTKEGANVAFQSTTSNPKGSKIEWKGSVKGNTVEGTMQRMAKDGTIVESSTFNGTVK